MILVTVGSSWTPFDRLVQAVELLPGEEPVLVQHGASRARPARAACVAFLPFDELRRRMRTARVVVTHAGVGSIMVALAEGKRPIVVPRLRRLGEAVDDHQLALARRLGEAGSVTLLEDVAGLPGAVSTPGPGLPPAPAAAEAGDLAAEVRGCLAEVVAAAGRGAR